MYANNNSIVSDFQLNSVRMKQLSDNISESQTRVQQISEQFKCFWPKCEFSSEYKCVLKSHIRIHNENKYSCDKCNKNYNYSTFLRHKRTVHSNVRQFECRINDCNKCFKTKSHLNQHELRHSVNKPFKCNFNCGKSFISESKLNAHIDSHNGIKRYKCYYNNCDKRYVTSNELKRHIRCSHSTQRPFKCEFTDCNKQFRTPSCLKMHIKYIHCDVIYSCKVSCCDWKFKSKSPLNCHTKYVHSNVRPFVCRISDCNKSFKTNKELIRHNISHSSERPFKCDECGKQLKSAAILRIHKRNKHKGLKSQI